MTDHDNQEPIGTPRREDTITINTTTLYYFGIAVLFFIAGFIVAWVTFSSANNATAEIRSVLNPVATEVASLRTDMQNLSAQVQSGLGSGAPALTPTPSGPVNIDVGSSPVWGNESATVTIVEFSDFECSFCARFYRDSYGLLKAKYQDKVRFVFKHFPISFIHPNAERAAVASECVREQDPDKFWAYHDLLFENQQDLSAAGLSSYARQIELANIEQFDQCVASNKYLSTVQADLQLGEQVGVGGTPTFFINGYPLVGAQPYAVFEQAIEQALASN